MSSINLNAFRSAGGISVEWVTKGPLLGDIVKQLPFAAALALNRTAQESVAIVRAEAAKKFRIRGDVGRRFFDLSFQITQYATKEKPEIAFGISRALLAGRSGFLTDFESGADRIAKGRNNFPFIPAIGSSLRPTINDLLPRWAYPSALGLQQSFNGPGADRTPGRRGSKRGLRARENRSAFILRNGAGDPLGIFRRVPLAGARHTSVSASGRKLTLAQRRRRSTGQSTLELLFATPKVIRIAPRLGFHALAEHTMLERLQANFEGMIAYALDEPRQSRIAAVAQLDASLIQAFRGDRGR